MRLATIAGLDDPRHLIGDYNCLRAPRTSRQQTYLLTVINKIAPAVFANDLFTYHCPRCNSVFSAPPFEVVTITELLSELQMTTGNNARELPAQAPGYFDGIFLPVM